MLKEGCSVSETARRMGVSRSTVMKYREGHPDVLCRSLHKGGILHQYREYIIENLQNGYTQSEVIRQLQQFYGYSKSRTLAHRYMEDLIKQYDLTVTRYRSSEQTTAAAHGMGASGEKYPVLWTLESCIREFRAIFTNKKLVLLYLFIEKYRTCPIQELSSFAMRLEKDIMAMENAVSSPLSNGFKGLTIN